MQRSVYGSSSLEWTYGVTLDLSTFLSNVEPEVLKQMFVQLHDMFS